MKEYHTGLRSKNADLYYEQGKQFENFVKGLFGYKFRLAKHRQARKLPPGTFIGDLCYPDLEMIFEGKKNYKFAVECKFRTAFYSDKINWAKSMNQVEVYLAFQRKFGLPVFVAIGIGGIPSDPEHLFVTPLDNICHSHEIDKNVLIPYKRKPRNKFFYDTVQLRLW